MSSVLGTNFRNSLTLGYTHCKIGDMDDKRKKVPIHIKLDADLYDVIQRLRDDWDRTQIWLIEKALRETYGQQLEESKRQPEAV